MKAVVMIIVCLALLAGIPVKAEDLGSVTLPRSVEVASTAVSAGTYTLALVESDNGYTIQLKQNGSVVAEDMAAIKSSDRKHDGARIMYQTLRQDKSESPIARVYVSYKGKLFFLYLDK